MYYILAALLIAADQIIKNVIKTKIPFNADIEVIPGFFKLVNWRNTGAAWGAFSNATFILGIISALSSVLIIYLIYKGISPFFKLSLSIILAGAVGNLIDRFRLKYVVDYLLFNIFGYDFPAFNLADMCIVIGCSLMIIFILFFNKEDEPLLKRPLFWMNNKKTKGENNADL